MRLVRLTSVEVKAKVSLSDENQAEKIEERAQMAEKYCLVSGSVVCPVEYGVEVVDEMSPAISKPEFVKYL